MNNKIYYIWLSQAFSSGSNKPYDIAKHFLDLKVFYEMSEDEMAQKFDFLTKQDIDCIKHTSLKRAEIIIKDCQDLNIDIVTVNERDYPNSLLLIYGVPIVLYHKGDISCLNEQLCISIVGTRNICDYSKKVTNLISSQLAQSGCIVISGGAVGVDSQAHAGALSVDGKTIVVMACGIDVNYPAQNLEQRLDILQKGGVLISELPPKTQVRSSYFPVRNRMISGLSQGVCLTHVPARSGASITAEYAIEQGRELFCVPPWDITDSSCTGVMKFIRDGCIVISNVNDILSEFTPCISTFEQNQIISQYKKQIINNDANLKNKSHDCDRVTSENINSSVDEDCSKTTSTISQFDLEEFKNSKIEYYNNLDEQSKDIFDCLSDTPKTLDEILAQTTTTISETLSILTDFEIETIVTSHSGRRYSFNLNQ